MENIDTCKLNIKEFAAKGMLSLCGCTLLFILLIAVCYLIGGDIDLLLQYFQQHKTSQKQGIFFLFLFGVCYVCFSLFMLLILLSRRTIFNR